MDKRNLLFTLFFLLISLISTSALANIAFVERIRGEVILNQKTATVGAKISEGDLIEAKGKKSFFVIRYDNGSRYMLRNGRLKVEKLNQVESEVYLYSGKLISSVKKNTYDKEKFKVKTRKMAMGVRGTKFWISEDPSESYLCVCEGEVSADNGVNKVYVKKNQDTTAKGKQSLKVTSANSQMLDMALADFEILGDPVK